MMKITDESDKYNKKHNKITKIKIKSNSQY